MLDWYLENYAPESQDPERWSLESLQGALKETFGFEVSLDEMTENAGEGAVHANLANPPVGGDNEFGARLVWVGTPALREKVPRSR